MLYDKLLVQRHAPATVLRGVDVAPAHEKPQNTGLVVGRGAGRLSGNGYITPLSVDVGMEVRFHEHSGIELEDGNPDLIILREDEILAWRWPAEEKTA
jgi:co-chaperonin GroES (HSP10)